MIIKLTDINGSEFTAEDVIEFNFTQSADAACDSFWARFCRGYDSEISKVRVYENGALIFNGLCDRQQITENESGVETYFYARSGASVLVDNEAQPFTYVCPTAKQLFFSNISSFGFTSSLPEIQSSDKYEVTKGTSCYGALSKFVALQSGGRIAVTPGNDIFLLKKSDGIKSLNTYKILSAVHTVNRCDPYSQIIFKRSSSDTEYSLHTKAGISDRLGINRVMYINLSLLPQWQRENTVLKKLRESYDDYMTLQVTVSGYVDEALMQRFSYHSSIISCDDYVLSEKRYIRNKEGELTYLVLKKINDIKEITYVD